jgi:hypothetical protein
MYGWQARPCMNLHGMCRWFSVVPQGFVLPFPSFFLLIFGALCCDFHGGVLRMISCRILVGYHVWGPCASLAGDLAPRTPLNRSRFGGFSSCLHYVKTSNRSRSICNRPLTPITSTHICNGCCLAPVTYKRTRTTPGLASTTPVTNVDFR